MYYLDYLILTNSSPLLSPPLSEVVITGTFKVTDITNQTHAELLAINILTGKE